MASYLDILAPSRVPDRRGTERRRGPADPVSCVWHDLRQLLNTRRPPASLTADYPELPTSVLNYGLRDFAFADLTTEDERQTMARHLAEVIAVFEPRLADVHVTPSDPDPTDPTHRSTVVHFHITGRLVGAGEEADAAFANVFECTTGHHEVKPT